MLPGNTSSSISIGGLYLPPDERVTTPLVDYELGGVALSDPSQGLMVKVWKAWLQLIDIRLQAEGGVATTLFQATQVTELSFCFDQNMQWAVAYIQEGVLKLRWFDSSVGGYVTSIFSQAVNPKLALDDKRIETIASSDMILAYLRDDALYYRQQRDRFQIEYLLRDNLFPGTKLKNIGMNKNLRLQFELV